MNSGKFKQPIVSRLKKAQVRTSSRLSTKRIELLSSSVENFDNHSQENNPKASIQNYFKVSTNDMARKRAITASR